MSEDSGQEKTTISPKISFHEADLKRRRQLSQTGPAVRHTTMVGGEKVVIEQGRDELGERTEKVIDSPKLTKSQTSG